MMDTTELRELCEGIRFHGRQTDDELVARIQGDIDEYRAKFLTRPAPPLPPKPLLDLLPLMGWLIYETSWYSVRQIEAAFESLPEAERAPSLLAYGQVTELANAARGLVWPEFAGRALGAIRALALAESKRDTERGYDAAYIAHLEASTRCQSYRDSHGKDPKSKRYILDLDEILLQLGLAETGTACRTAERVIGRWADSFATRDKAGNDFANDEDEARWVQRMYRDLSDAVEIGGRALETAKRIKDTYGLVHRVSELRLALVTGYRNPGIMTGRAALLALALTPAMEHLRREPHRAATWKEERADLIARFTTAYHAIEEPVRDAEGKPVPMILDHKRALLQLRLNLALLVPGQSLPATDPFDPCLERDPLDDEAVAAMSRWLAEEPTDGGRNHGSTIGSATLPLFIQSFVALRSLTGDGDGYPAWRRRWPDLGRFSTEAGRHALIEAALDAAARRPSLDVSAE